MAVSYKKLWIKLIEKEMTKTDLRKKCGFGSATLAKMGRNEMVSSGILMSICDVLQCNISDILDYIPEPKQENENEEPSAK